LKFGTADAEADIEDDKEFASPASANNLSLNSRIQEYNKIYPNCTKSMKETSNHDGCSDNMKYGDNNPQHSNREAQNILLTRQNHSILETNNLGRSLSPIGRPGRTNQQLSVG